MDGLVGGSWCLTVTVTEMDTALGSGCSGISVYSVYIYILQQCCNLVIIYDATTRIPFIFFFSSHPNVDLILSAKLRKGGEKKY